MAVSSWVARAGEGGSIMRALREQLVIASALGVALLLMAALFAKLGLLALLVPVGLAAAAFLLQRPLLTVLLTVTLVALCEGPSFGLFTFTAKLYGQLYRDISRLDVLVGMAVVAVFLDVLRRRERLYVPRPLALPLSILFLAMIVAVITGQAAGEKLRFVIFSEHILAYLLLLPIAVANLEIDEATIKKLLVGVVAFSALKALLGLIEIAGHYGQAIYGTATLTYYEPAANWLIMVTMFGLLAARSSGMRLPRWTAPVSALLLASFVLSYRRSFWIAGVLGLVLVVIVAGSQRGRRTLLISGLLLAGAVWAAGSIAVESQSPIIRRVESLNPSRLENNAQDEYRLDEEANVIAEIGKNPITGIGITTPWHATAQPLAVEHAEGRLYTHFAALWYWLKMGILGLVAYLGIIIGSLVLAWQAWHRSTDAMLRAFAVASLCAVASLAVLDGTASFTGVDARLTVLLAFQLGLLGRMLRIGATRPVASAALVPRSGG
ncbi:MAG TPA: O-antigen ligase family protein [Solirubrobacteraceae bacterium]|nr:O-antigen ligase family protein [Solirubrobacteraceae bacterium]